MKTSESNTELYKAFIKFQGEVKQPKKNATNPHFKSDYSTLDEIIKTVTPTLTKYGLAIMQEVTGDGSTVNVATRMIHESGEWIETEPLTLKCDKSTPQGQGSAASYGRRYALSAVLGISSEDDDDGNEASKPKAKAAAVKPTQKTEPPTEPQAISPNSIKALHAIRNDLGRQEDEFKAGLGKMLKRDLKSLKDLSEQEAKMLIAALNKLRESRRTA